MSSAGLGPIVASCVPCAGAALCLRRLPRGGLCGALRLAPRGGASWTPPCAWADVCSARPDAGLQLPPLLGRSIAKARAERSLSSAVTDMSDEKDSLRGDAEKGEEPVVRAIPGGAIPGGAFSLKQAEEVDPLKLEVAMGADGFSDSCSEDCSDDLSCAAAHIDPNLLLLVADEEKCRNIRRQYRQLIYNVQQNREDIVNTASDSLTEALEEANVLFDGVSRTREAALDAQFLVLASDLGKEKAKQLNSDMSFFNQVAFCDFLFIFVGLNWMEDDERDALNGCDDNIVLSFWETVHKEATSWISQAETFHFLFGSFKSESSAPKRRPGHHKKAPRVEENVDMPTKLRRLDLSSNQEGTEKEVERILGLLQTYFRKYPDTPVSYFEFVIDPNSFSRTVENIFYVSFIIRDGFARIRLDQDRLPILEPINVNQGGEENDPSSHGRKQGVISLSLQDWKNIVATFEISEAMIKSSY